jgi:hypothetical protein
VSHFSFFFVGVTALDGGAPDGSPGDGPAADGGSDVPQSDASTNDAAVDSGDAGASPLLTCGAAPLQAFTVNALVIGSMPPSVIATSSVCAAGTNAAIPATANASGALGSGLLSLGEVAQHLTLTARDGSTYPTLTFEFVPGPAIAAAPLTTLLWAKTAPFGPQGFGTGGKALVMVLLSKKSTAAAPCNATAGVTVALDSASATAHPEAVISYDQGNGVWSTTGPTIGSNTAAIILTPSSATDFVQIVATKTGCTADTGVAAGALRTAGLTGQIPLAADSVSMAEVGVGP